METLINASEKHPDTTSSPHVPHSTAIGGPKRIRFGVKAKAVAATILTLSIKPFRFINEQIQRRRAHTQPANKNKSGPGASPILQVTSEVSTTTVSSTQPVDVREVSSDVDGI